MPPTLPRPVDAYPIVVHRDYIAELARRVSAVGVGRCATAAGMSRTSLWATLSDRKPTPAAASKATKRKPRPQLHRATYSTVMRILDALATLDPSAAPMPPPITLVGGPSSPSWRAAVAATRKRR